MFKLLCGVLIVITTSVKAELPRLIVCTDIRGEGEPDDSFSLAHLLYFQDQFEILGFVISRPHGSKHQFKRVLKAFLKDNKKYNFNLKTNFKIKQGAISRAPQVGYSTATQGSKFIARMAKRGDLIVLCWGSCNDVAQAVHDNPQIVKNLKVFLGGVIGYNFQQDPYPYYYLSSIKNLTSIWTDKAGRGMNADSKDRYSPKNFVKRVLKPRGALGKLLNQLAPFTTTRGLKWGDSQGVLFTMSNGWKDPTKLTLGGKFKKIPGTKHFEDLPNGSDYIQRRKALKQWEKRISLLYGSF